MGVTWPGPEAPPSDDNKNVWSSSSVHHLCFVGFTVATLTLPELLQNVYFLVHGS